MQRQQNGMQRQRDGMQDKTDARISISNMLSCIPFVFHCIFVARDILLNQPHSRAPQRGQPFNPTSVSLDIRTPEELQAVNAFLLALGIRDIASLPIQATPARVS